MEFDVTITPSILFAYYDDMMTNMLTVYYSHGSSALLSIRHDAEAKGGGKKFCVDRLENRFYKISVLTASHLKLLYLAD
jgi:hypothetical protein